MSYELADGTLSTDYKKGDKFKVVQNESSCSETTVGEIVILEHDDMSRNPYFVAEDDSGSGERVCCWDDLEEYLEASQPETYTQSELSYITELEDRVEYLESLCSDYAKIVTEKDKEIFQLKHQALRVASETVLHVEQDFKPISDMTIEDWEVAMLHAWEFETISKGNVVVIELDDFNECLPICVKTSESKCQWLNENGLGTDNPEWSIVKRTK